MRGIMIKDILLSILLGYLLGTLSPSALISKLKSKNLREHGTGNLGATNTMLVFGKIYGVAVMIFDIAKAVVAVKLAEMIFVQLPTAGLIAGTAAVIGHIFPFYLKFRGGKGLASFGGAILALDPVLFLILLVITVGCVIIFNYTVTMPMSAGVLFPIMYGLRTKSLTVGLISGLLGIVIILRHVSNVKRVINGGDVKMRPYLAKHLFGRDIKKN